MLQLILLSRTRTRTVNVNNKFNKKPTLLFRSATYYSNVISASIVKLESLDV